MDSKFILRGLILFLLILSSSCFGSNVIPADAYQDYTQLSKYFGFSDIEIIKLDWGIHNLVTDDFNNDGLGDMAVINNRKSKIEFLLQSTTPVKTERVFTSDTNDIDINELTESERYAKDQFLLNVKAYNLASGDLNNDGLEDIAFYGKPNGLYLVLQKPRKASTDGKILWHSSIKINIDDGLASRNGLLCDDINADSLDDLILAGKKSLYIITQQDDGQLSKAVKYALNESPLYMSISDLNGDKIKDLAVITSDRDWPIKVRFGQKDGQLGPEKQYFVEKLSGAWIDDYDKDGSNELLCIDAQSSRLNSYKFTAADTEKKVQDNKPDITVYPISGEQANRKIAQGDINGDGRADIVVSDPEAAEFLYYQRIGKSFAEAAKYPALSKITALKAVDLDNNKKDELVVLSVEEKTIAISRFDDGRITFPEALDISGEPLAMDVADIDNNKKLDCIYVYKDANDIRHLNIITDLGTKKQKLSDIDITLEDLQSNPEGLEIIDADADGLGDAVIFVSSYSDPIFIHQADKGKFEIVKDSSSRVSLIKNANLLNTSLVKFSGKKEKSFIIANKNYARNLVFEDGIKWQVVEQFNANRTDNNIDLVLADDTDGDKKNEIILIDGGRGLIQVLKAGDDNTFRSAEEYEIGRWLVKDGFVDDIKGKSEIILFDQQRFAVIDISKKTAGLDLQFTYETKIKDGKYGKVTVGDINGDADKDIIMVENSRDHIEILALDENNQPSPAMRFKVYEQKSYEYDDDRRITEPRELIVSDVTGDGWDDLIGLIHDRIIVYPQDR